MVSKKLSTILITILLLQGCISADIVHVKTTSWGDKSKITQQAVKKVENSDDKKWAGVIVGLVFPIPLIIPYGHESTTSWWVDGDCVYSESTETIATGYGCNVELEICGQAATWGTLMFNLDRKVD
jgi:hypothetical protein